MLGFLHLITGLLVATQLTTASVLPRDFVKSDAAIESETTSSFDFNLEYGKDTAHNPLVGHFNINIEPTEDACAPARVQLNGQPLIQDDAGSGHGLIPLDSSRNVTAWWTFLCGGVGTNAQQNLRLTIQNPDVVPLYNSTVAVLFTSTFPVVVHGIIGNDILRHPSDGTSATGRSGASKSWPSTANDPNLVRNIAQLKAFYRQARDVLAHIRETEDYIVQNYGVDQLPSFRLQSDSPADTPGDADGLENQEIEMHVVERPDDPNSKERKVSASHVISPARVVESPAFGRQPFSWDDINESLINVVGAFSIAAVAWVFVSGGILLFHICRRTRVQAIRASQAGGGRVVANEQGRATEDASAGANSHIHSTLIQPDLRLAGVHRETRAERLARAHNRRAHIRNSVYDMFRDWFRSLTNADLEKTAAQQQEEHDRRQVQADSAGEPPSPSGEVETTMEEELARFRIAANMVDDIIAAGGSRAAESDEQQRQADSQS